MLSYLLRRLLLIIPTHVGISCITYGVARMAPGDPTSIQLLAGEGKLNEHDSEKIAQEMKRAYGLDKPIYLGYLDWVRNVLRGDLGNSFQFHRGVLGIIAERIPNTLILEVI